MRIRWWKIKQFLSPFKNPIDVFYRIRRMLFHWNPDVRIFTKTQLKSEMGLRWTKKEREAVKIILDRTIR